MNVWRALFPRFNCHRCGCELRQVTQHEDGSGPVWPVRVLIGLLATTPVVIALALVPGTSVLLLLLALMSVAGMVADRRVVRYRCPICGAVRSHRELTGTAGEHPPDEPPRDSGPDARS